MTQCGIGLKKLLQVAAFSLIAEEQGLTKVNDDASLDFIWVLEAAQAVDPGHTALMLGITHN